MPPFLKLLVLEKPLITPKFDWLGELNNVCYDPITTSNKKIPIYAKTIRELCIWRHGRKPKDPAIIHMVGKLENLIIGKPLASRYEDLGIPTVIVKKSKENSKH